MITIGIASPLRSNSIACSHMSSRRHLACGHSSVYNGLTVQIPLTWNGVGEDLHSKPLSEKAFGFVSEKFWEVNGACTTLYWDLNFLYFFIKHVEQGVFNRPRGPGGGFFPGDPWGGPSIHQQFHNFFGFENSQCHSIMSRIEFTVRAHGLGSVCTPAPA